MRSFLLLLLVIGCGPARSNRWDPTILESYEQETLEERAQHAENLGESMQQQLARWKQEVLEGSNVLSVISLRRDTRARVRYLEGRLGKLKMRSAIGLERELQLLPLQLQFALAKLSSIDGFLPTAPLPNGQHRKIENWRKRVLNQANRESALSMRDKASERVDWLEGKIKALDEYHPDVGWKDNVRYHLLLSIENWKLRYIDDRLGS